MMIELIIGESMNQHSQISEKIFAFQRAVNLSIMASQISKEQNQMNAMSFADVDPIKHAKYKV